MRVALLFLAGLAITVGGWTASAWAGDGIEPGEAPAKAAPAGKAARLPSGFVRIRDIEPGIIEDMRYATEQNFTGRPVPGYTRGRCILARPVALALAKVHRAIRAEGYAIKVYDCYRPIRAVRAFVRWAGGAGAIDTKFYYPRIPRDSIIPLGYIAERSSHSLGTAIDLTLVRVKEIAAGQVPDAARSVAPPGGGAKGTCIAATPQRAAVTSLNMGTSWDCFDVLSHTRTAGISPEARENRRILVQAMVAHGFRNYSREWWHFSMPHKAFQSARDFPVE